MSNRISNWWRSLVGCKDPEPVPTITNMKDTFTKEELEIEKRDRERAERVMRNEEREKKRSEEWLSLVELMGIKELMLSEIIVWLKAKDLWEECKKSLSVKIIK